MAFFTVIAPRQNANPRRVMNWTGAARAGDDFKFAFTLLNEDGETPADVTQSNSRMSIVEDEREFMHWDYGFPYSVERVVSMAEGWVFNGPSGRLNFFIPASRTGALCEGRYRLFFEVDQPDGVTTEATGLLQLSGYPHATLGNQPRSYMRTGTTPTGKGLLPPMVIGNVPTDTNGFPLLASFPASIPDGNAIPGRMIPGQLILGGSGVSTTSIYAPTNIGSAVPGLAVLGGMVLGEI